MIERFVLPDVGEGLTEAEIVTWLVAPGDTVEINQTVVEIETAKSVVELPVPFAGTVAELHAAVGETVELGDTLLSVDTAVGGAGSAGSAGGAAVPAEGSAGGAAGGGAALRGEESADSAFGVNNIHPEDAVSPARTSPARTGVPAAAPAPAPAPEEGGANLVGYGASKRPKSRRAERRSASGAQGSSSGVSAQLGNTEPSAQNAQAPQAARPGGRAVTTGLGGIPVIARPPIRKLAKDLGVTLSEASGTGANGEVTRQDVIDHAQQASVFRNIETPAWPTEREQVVPVAVRRGVSGVVGRDAAILGESGGAVPGAAGSSGISGARDTTGSAANAGLAGGAAAASAAVNAAGEADPGRDEIVKVHGVRRSIARAMVSSAFTAPHVTVFVDVDATRTMEYVKRLKASPSFAGLKVSPLLIVAKAVIWAAQRNPEVNSSFDDEQITIHHYVNLGIAAATPRGLLVPNIKEAQSLGLRELAQALGDLTATARAGRTQPAEMAQGTITITNIGVFGMDAGTPILNPGEVAIVAMGAIRQKPWVVDGEVRPRFVTTVSASFDHRVVDGDVASRFTADVASVLEEPALLLDV